MQRAAVTDRHTAARFTDTTSSDRRRTEVLLVTPDGDLREAGERALASRGYNVRVAAHSGHAVLAGLTARVDVLVAELWTPDISGPALAQLLRKHHPALRVVFMANPGTPEGIDHVVVRPFTRDDLIARIDATSSPGPQALSAS
jgi:DNA-binding response OmpR family regulator